MNLHAAAGAAYFDNSEQRLRLAYRDSRKRRQAAGASHPAFLAIDRGILAAHVEDFDLALLGSSVQHLGFDRETVGFSFRPWTGEMLADSAGPWAGVLAFIGPGIFEAHDPILFVSPHFRGNRPLAFIRLRNRRLAVDDFPARGPRVTDRIRFAEPLADE